MKHLNIEPPETRQLAEDNDVYYTLTLDPAKREHRIVALLIDYTSAQGECGFYNQGDHEKCCNIAPRFTIPSRDCSGRCFVDGLTCPIILEHLEDQKSDGDEMND